MSTTRAPHNLGPPSADTPQTLTPEQVVEQLRVLRNQIADVAPLTAVEREAARLQGRVPNTVVQASINVIGASEGVSHAVGQSADEVRQLVDETNRWTAVEDELRGMLKGISDANLGRRQRAGIIAAQAYLIGQQLARVPGNAVLRPHVQEIKRLRALARGRKPAAQPPQTPQSPAATPDTSATPEK
jgi:hypothetical protein